MAYTPSTPPAFIEPFAERLSDLTVEQINRPYDTTGMGPKVSQFSPLLQAAQQRTATQAGLGSLQYNPQGEVTGIGQGTGVAAYEPYLQRAESLAAPTAYQAYMSPYQQEVIDATQALLGEQRASGLSALRGSQAYSQSILDAIQQQNILNETFPLQRLGSASNIFTGVASGIPSQPGQPIMTSPALAGVQTLASIYGALNPPRPKVAAGGLMSLLSSLGV